MGPRRSGAGPCARRERRDPWQSARILLLGLGRRQPVHRSHGRRRFGDQLGIARSRACIRAALLDQGGDQRGHRELRWLLLPVLEFLRAQGAGAVLLVVAIPRVETLEYGKLAHLPLPDLGAPYASVPDIAQCHPDRGFLAGPHGTPLEFVGAIDGSIARPRRLLQRRKRVADVVIAAHLIERRDDATHQKPDQIEHRITNAQDAPPAPLRLALGLLADAPAPRRSPDSSRSARRFGIPKPQCGSRPRGAPRAPRPAPQPGAGRALLPPLAA